MKKAPLGEKPSVEILQDLNKSIDKKQIPILKKKYPGAPVENKDLNRYYYQHVRNIFEPPEEYTLEERIQEMEAFLNSILDENNSLVQRISESGN